MKSTQLVLDEAKKINKEVQCFTHIATTATSEKNSSFFFSVKDSVWTKDLPTQAGSKILEGFIPPEDATVVKRMRDAGGVLIGKTAMDEFGFGSFSTNVGKGFTVPKNPCDHNRTTGGSSGGAACYTALADENHIAIAQSTGGSIACPASFCGVVGFTPSYGAVSRYGLIDYANSLDKIGVMGKSVSICKKGFDIIKGPDGKDETCVIQGKNTTKTPLRVGLVSFGFGKGVNKQIAEMVQSCAKKLGDCTLVDLPLTSSYALEAYYIIAMTEASTNLARLCGLRYGKEEEVSSQQYNKYFSHVRSAFFGDEAKRRILLGTFARMSGYRNAYYTKALKVRSKIIAEYQKLFTSFDILVTPTMPVVAPFFSDIKKLSPLQSYAMDILTVGPNLAGLPHITLPCGSVDKMPVGIQFIGATGNDDLVLSAALELEVKLRGK